MICAQVKGLFGVLGPTYKVFLTSTDAPAVTQDMRTLTELVESGALKPLVDARDFELTTAGVGDIVKACPNLTSLDVSGNRLQLTSAEDLAPLKNLKSLAANGVGLKSWEEI